MHRYDKAWRRKESMSPHSHRQLADSRMGVLVLFYMPVTGFELVGLVIRDQVRNMAIINYYVIICRFILAPLHFDKIR